jgi:putative membrane protein
MHVLLRLLINAAALWVATRLVSGISYTGDGVSLFGVALVFGVLNVLIKPVLFLVSLPFVILTLGLFTLVLNALMLLLTGVASDAIGLGFSVDGFLPALKGALVVSVVSFLLSLFVSDSDTPKRKAIRK